MANMNVKKRLESIESDLYAVLKHVSMYSGIDAKDAMAIDRIAAGISEAGAALAAEARAVSGNTSGKTLVKNVRKALGYTRP